MKLYNVHLTEAHRTELQELIHKGSAPAQIQTRARILLMVDRGDRDVDIAKALFTSTPTVQRTRVRFCAEGVEGAVYPKPKSGRPPTFTGEVYAHLTMLACSDPPPGRARWTLQLLANKLVELHIVESISDVQVGKMLKKTGCVPGK